MTFRKAHVTPSTRSASGLFALTFGAVLACGPSLKSVHEGTVRFEHCNRLDLDQKIAKQECGRCWTNWLAEYTYGQPRDRIDYARRRARAAANGDESRPVLAFGEHTPEARQFYMVVPGPTSVRTPPPPVATVWKESDADAGALAKTSSEGPPAESCADDCRGRWQTCSAGCSHGNGSPPNVAGPGNGNNHVAAGGKGNGASKGTDAANKGPTPANVCQKCRSDYSTCMRRCFE
jgi:hypothetical protein